MLEAATYAEVFRQTRRLGPPQRQGKKPDMMVRVHRGVGPETGATTITYSPMAGAISDGVFTPEGCENGNASSPITRNCLRTGGWVVARLERDAGLAPSDAAAMGTRRTFEYRYAGGYRDRESGVLPIANIRQKAYVRV